MARKRMIDPNIWQSEDFGKLSSLAKIVFIGLFSLADDEGRGRANPVYLSSTLFPYNEKMRSTDIEVALSEISRNMSIVFYSYNGKNYYELINWYDFQKIDKPSKSKLPEFDKDNKEIRQLFVEGSPKASRKVAPKRKEENIKEIKENRKRIRDIYNLTCEKLPQIQKITDKREKAIDKFLKQFTIEQFEQICKIANESSFLTGDNERGWKADFDFIINTDKATSILELKYSNSKQPVKQTNFQQREYTDLNKLYVNTKGG